MGTFVVTVRAVGNHGCERDKKHGEEVVGCGQPYCTDCITREYVAKLKEKGANVEEATILHWPNSTPQILDNLVTKKRTGNF